MANPIRTMPRFRGLKTLLLCLFFSLILSKQTQALYLLIPMDEQQHNQLKAYGIAYWTLGQAIEVKWLLNYRGGSFLVQYSPEMERECLIRGVDTEKLPDAKANLILSEIASPSVNQDAVSMQKAPKIAVYSPKNKQPWDDAVTMVLTYAEIEYDLIYDQEILNGRLNDYDWLHLHHEDFTGQFGKFYANYRNMPWYQEEVRTNEELARNNGFLKVSEMKLAVAEKVRNYVDRGGFLFAMCAATDTYDIAMAAHGTDICGAMFDGDPTDPDANQKLDYEQSLAFTNFRLEMNPYQYKFSDIDVTTTRQVPQNHDFFSLFEFSAKWDPVPTMLTQNHQRVIRGFMGQTTAFNSKLVKSKVLVMGENKVAGEARYIHGESGKGFWTFYGGHDPEDYRHLVGDPPTDLSLYPNSPGYRLILNNVLFPAAKKKKQKT
ncbi:MAG: hypothetical protein ACK5JD_04195 [Mangrovibacterium sp.]